MTQLKGRLTSSEPIDFATFLVILSGLRTVSRDEDENNNAASGSLIRYSVKAEVRNDGKFTIEMPDGWTQDPSEIDVYSPTGLLSAHHLVSSGEIQGAEIVLDVPPQTQLTIPDGESPPMTKPRLRGRVIDASGKTQINGAQVIIWANESGLNPYPVLVAHTDSQGYFFGDISPGIFEKAYGVVSASPEEKVKIPLSNGAFDSRVIIVIHLPEKVEKKEKDDCGCVKPGTTVPRIPDMEALTSSPGAYSTDIGIGGCIDFTVPNRALEEFSYFSIVRTTQPRLSSVRRPVASSETIPGVKLAGANTLNIDGLDVSIDYEFLAQNPRRSVGPSNPIPWNTDASALTYQASTIANGHLLHFKQEWIADGYSLGDLLYSLPLAPCEKKQIAIVDWQRQERANRGESETAADRLEASIERSRDISEMVNTTLSESMRGGSTASNWGVAGGLGAAASYMGLGAVIGVSGGAGGADASAWQDSSRTVGAGSLQWLRDRTMQAASDLRTAHRNVVVTVSQKESVQTETSVVHNHNHCHAITIEYFEVLRHLQVRQYLSEVRECLLVPLLMSVFDAPKIFRWREQIEHVLRDWRLSSAFDAVERQVLNFKGLDVPDARYADDIVEHIAGQLTLKFTLVRPADTAENKFNKDSWEFLKTLFSAADLPVPLAITPEDIYKRIFSNPLSLINPMNILDSIGDLFSDDEPAPLPAEPTPAQKDETFQKNFAPLIASAYCRALKFRVGIVAGGDKELDLIPTLIDKYSDGTTLHISLNLGSNIDLRRANIDSVIVSGGAGILPASSNVILHDIHLDYRTSHIRHTLLDYTFDQDIVGRPATARAPLDTEESRNPRQENADLVSRLVGHLNDHVEFYHRAIWMGMDQERRYLLLDSVAAPGVNPDGRSVASVVENRLLGIIGNSLVLPVAPGFKLDPSYAAKSQAELIKVYSGTDKDKIPPMRISIPTSGVYAESIMGVCNSCEKKDESRFWRFEESPCGDEPTPINPPSTESRRTDPGNLVTKDLAAPIIAMQTAPSAPDPTGIASALQVLGTSNLFKDITGLSDTQKAALASFQSSLQAAQEFGKQATNLSMASLGKQAQTTANSDRIFQSIDSAQQTGHITNEQAAGLKQQAIKQMIGSGGQPLVTDLNAIEQAKAKGLINDEQAKLLTSAGLSRLMGGTASDVSENQLGLPSMIKSAVEASNSSLSYTRSGDSESLSIDKVEKAEQIGDTINTYAKICVGILKPNDVAIFPFLLRVDIYGGSKLKGWFGYDLSYSQYIKGTVTLWERVGVGEAAEWKKIEVIILGKVALDTNPNARVWDVEEDDGWVEDLPKGKSSGPQVVDNSNTSRISINQIEEGHLVYKFDDRPGRTNVLFGKRPDGKILRRITWDASIRHRLWDTTKSEKKEIFKEEFRLTGTVDCKPGLTPEDLWPPIDSRELIRGNGTKALPGLDDCK